MTCGCLNIPIELQGVKKWWSIARSGKCVYPCMCICIHTAMHIYIYVYVYIYIYTHVYMYMSEFSHLKNPSKQYCCNSSLTLKDCFGAIRSALGVPKGGPPLHASCVPRIQSSTKQPSSVPKLMTPHPAIKVQGTLFWGDSLRRTPPNKHSQKKTGTVEAQLLLRTECSSAHFLVDALRQKLLYLKLDYT